MHSAIQHSSKDIIYTVPIQHSSKGIIDAKPVQHSRRDTAQTVPIQHSNKDSTAIKTEPVRRPMMVLRGAVATRRAARAAAMRG